MSSMRDASVMMKYEADRTENSMLSPLSTDSMEDSLTATLYRLAYSWTHDVRLAKQLVSQVMQEHKRCAIDQCDGGELGLYARLFQRWCMKTDDCFQVNPVHSPASRMLSDSAFLQQCVSSLPKYQRVVLTLVDIADLSYRQVSYIVNVEERKIRSWLTDARMTILQQKRLRTCS